MCENSFWFWFMRPFAETLGAIAMVGSVAFIILLLFWIAEKKKQ